MIQAMLSLQSVNANYANIYIHISLNDSIANQIFIRTM